VNLTGSPALPSIMGIAILRDPSSMSYEAKCSGTHGSGSSPVVAWRELLSSRLRNPDVVLEA
jgi:hypothetical protein